MISILLLYLLFKHYVFLLICTLKVYGHSLYNKIVPTIRESTNTIILKGANELDQVRETSDPGQPSMISGTTTRKQTGMRHKVGMGLRKPEYAVNTT